MRHWNLHHLEHEDNCACLKDRYTSGIEFRLAGDYKVLAHCLICTWAIDNLSVPLAAIHVHVSHRIFSSLASSSLHEADTNFFSLVKGDSESQRWREGVGLQSDPIKIGSR